MDTILMLLPLLKPRLGSLVRGLTKAASGWLVGHGILAPAGADAWVASTTELLVGLVLYGAAEAWSWYAANKEKLRTEVARQAPQAMTEKQLETAVEVALVEKKA